MMKQALWTLAALTTAMALAACGGKKKTDDVIVDRIEVAKPTGAVKMQEYTDERGIDWIGRKYHVAIHRHPSDSLPKVKDETGQLFVDNAISLAVSRQDGSVFYSHTFTKQDFLSYLDEDYRKTGILEGFVFDKADGDWLEFAASVSHPQTDEYIPLVVRLSRMGELSVRRDTQMDTNSVRTEEDDV